MAEGKAQHLEAEQRQRLRLPRLSCQAQLAWEGDELRALREALATRLIDTVAQELATAQTYATLLEDAQLPGSAAVLLEPLTNALSIATGEMQIFVALLRRSGGATRRS